MQTPARFVATQRAPKAEAFPEEAEYKRFVKRRSPGQHVESGESGGTEEFLPIDGQFLVGEVTINDYNPGEILGV